MSHHVRENASYLLSLLGRAFNGSASPPSSARSNYTIVSCMLSVNWMVWLPRFILGAYMLFGILPRSNYPRMKLMSNQRWRFGLGKGGKGMLIRPNTTVLLRRMGRKGRQLESILDALRCRNWVRSPRHSSCWNSALISKSLRVPMRQVCWCRDRDLTVSMAFWFYWVRKQMKAKSNRRISYSCVSLHSKMAFCRYLMHSPYYSFMQRCRITSHFQYSPDKQSNCSQLQALINGCFNSYSSYCLVRKVPSRADLMVSPALPPFSKSPLYMLKQLEMAFISAVSVVTFWMADSTSSQDLHANSTLVTQVGISSSFSQRSMQSCRSSKHFSTKHSLTNVKSPLFKTYQALPSAASDSSTKLDTSSLSASLCSVRQQRIMARARQARPFLLTAKQALISLKAERQLPIRISTSPFMKSMVEVADSASLMAVARDQCAFVQSSIRMWMMALKWCVRGWLLSTSFSSTISKVRMSIWQLSSFCCWSSRMLMIAMRIRMAILQRRGRELSKLYFWK